MLTTLLVNGVNTGLRDSWKEHLNQHLVSKFTRPNDAFKQTIQWLWELHCTQTTEGRIPPFPDFADFLYAWSMLRMRKAVGADGISAEVLHSLPIYCVVTIYPTLIPLMCSHPFEGQLRPKSWKRLELVGLPKCDNWSSLGWSLALLAEGVHFCLFSSREAATHAT